MGQTLEQLRAKYALEKVMAIRKQCDELDVDKYSTFVSRTPTLILNNGLGQALAFLLPKNGENAKNSEDAAVRFYGELESWLCGIAGEPGYPARVYKGNNLSLIEELISGDRKKYMRAQAEALSLLNWMRKFVNAYLSDKEGKDDDTASAS